MPRQPVAVDRPSASEASSPEIIAAVDLGSNSFHMIVGELRHGQLTVIDRIRETVRLAEGLSPNGDLSDDARDRALDCLSRFGERLRDMHADTVRAAGTSTIRKAREDSSFMAQAEARLGHPIEVISGFEEARLVYGGVTQSLPPTEGLRLVTDIGGGSTEVILGQAAAPLALESLNLGCVSMTERYFSDGRLTSARFHRARLAARLELRPVKAFFRDADEFQAIGTSGTIREAERVARELGLVEGGITAQAIELLIEKVLEFDSIGDLSLKGLSEKRAQVWPGGLSILAELFRTLRIDEMFVSEGALREGLLYDLLGRVRHEDARERTVRSMASRYNVDAAQASRVTDTATHLYQQCADTWNLRQDTDKFLNWAANLHEIGLDISHDGYQHHGAYVAEHADMPGFPRAEQRMLAVLIRSQRLRIDESRLDKLPDSWRETALRLVIILRLAVLLNRSRSSADQPSVSLSAVDKTASIGFDSEWLADNPLTIADLEREQQFLADAGFELTIL